MLALTALARRLLVPVSDPAGARRPGARPSFPALPAVHSRSRPRVRASSCRRSSGALRTSRRFATSGATSGRSAHWPLGLVTADHARGGPGGAQHHPRHELGGGPLPWRDRLAARCRGGDRRPEPPAGAATLITVLEGESLVNDATALVLYRAAVAAMVTGAFSMASTAGSFVIVATVGIAIGFGVGWLNRWSVRHMPEGYGQMALTLLAPYVAWVLAERVHASRGARVRGRRILRAAVLQRRGRAAGAGAEPRTCGNCSSSSSTASSSSSSACSSARCAGRCRPAALGQVLRWGAAGHPRRHPRAPGLDARRRATGAHRPRNTGRRTRSRRPSDLHDRLDRDARRRVPGDGTRAAADALADGSPLPYRSRDHPHHLRRDPRHAGGAGPHAGAAGAAAGPLGRGRYASSRSSDSRGSAPREAAIAPHRPRGAGRLGAAVGRTQVRAHYERRLQRFQPDAALDPSLHGRAGRRAAAGSPRGTDRRAPRADCASGTAARSATTCLHQIERELDLEALRQGLGNVALNPITA